MTVSPLASSASTACCTASAEFVRRIVEALFKIRHLGRVAHGSRQAFQLGAEDFAGDEVHIRFLSAGWRGCRGRLRWEEPPCGGNHGRGGPPLCRVSLGGGVSVSPPLHSFHTEGLLAGRPPHQSKVLGDGGEGATLLSEGGFSLPPISLSTPSRRRRFRGPFPLPRRRRGCNNRLRRDPRKASLTGAPPVVDFDLSGKGGGSRPRPSRHP